MWTKLRGRAQQECKVGKHVGKWKQRWKGGYGMMGAEESATNVYAEVKLEAE